ncbi:BMC domain-containing protein [Sodalis sp. RH15]|uniref:BMC domain-containing protein n=1 Tax=Sodalis sp. RH15 TaxID=3394330 RepID=UPI0039B63DDD
MKTSLGLLEVAGLALAVKAADRMVKAADVKITGIERTNGSGWMLVSVTGDVASVKAAITDGAALARLEHGWVADRVIARPAAALASWIAPKGASAVSEQETGDTEPSPPGPATAHSESAVIPAPAAGCNLCHDPACTRRKGEPRGACLHYALHHAQRGDL